MLGHAELQAYEAGAGLQTFAKPSLAPSREGGTVGLSDERVARPGHDVLVLLLRSHVVVRVRFRLCCALSPRFPARLARYVHIHELPDSRGQRPATRLLQHHAGGHAIRHYPRRHQDHLRTKVPAGVQELAHCPDAPLLPPSDSRGHNSSSPTLQAGGGEGAEGDRGRDTR